MTESRATYTLDQHGKATHETRDGITMPLDYSFASINDFVHNPDVHFETLQALALGMAVQIDKLTQLLDNLRALPDRPADGMHAPTDAMVEAAAEAYMPFGDMGFALMAAYAAAPQAPAAIKSAAQLTTLLENVRSLHDICAEFIAADVFAQLETSPKDPAAPDVVGLVEALKELISAAQSVNCSRRHLVVVEEDDEPCYWQRGEWVDWLVASGRSASAALAAYQKREGV